MQTKKIVSLILALIILIGGVFFVAKWIKNKSTTQPITTEQKAFADKFTQDMQAAKNKAKKDTVNVVEEGKGNKTSNKIIK